MASRKMHPRISREVPSGRREGKVAWDALSNTYVCLFDGACRLALEATSPAEHAVPRSRHTKWCKCESKILVTRGTHAVTINCSDDDLGVFEASVPALRVMDGTGADGPRSEGRRRIVLDNSRVYRPCGALGRELKKLIFRPPGSFPSISLDH